MKKVLCLILAVMMVIGISTITTFAEDQSVTLRYYAPSIFTIYIPAEFYVGSPLTVTGESLNLTDDSCVEVYAKDLENDMVTLTHTSDDTKKVYASLYNSEGETLTNNGMICSFSSTDEGASHQIFTRLVNIQE